MLIFMNLIGAIFAAIGLLAFVFLLNSNGAKGGLMIAGAIMAVGDLLYRNIVKPEGEDVPFLHPKRGGNIMFIPVWIVGVIVFVIGLFS